MPELLNKTMIANKQMLVSEAVAKLKYFARLYGIRSIFIVGGYCREHYLGTIWKVKDIDVASAYEDQALQLGGLFSSEILKAVPRFYERTGTAMMEYPSEFGSIKIEFQSDSVSSYMHDENVRAWMQEEKIDDVPLMNNIYERDFTINSLIYSLHNGSMFDPTGRAIPDFDSRIIQSLLPANMLIKYNPLAALRAVRFALQYDFHIHPELRSVIKTAGVDNLKASLSEERILKEIVKILEVEAVEGLNMLKKLELDRILLDPAIKKYLYVGSKQNDKD